MRYIFCLIFVVILMPASRAQQPQKPSSSEIFESIKKLNFLGTVLYVAAHPDDENTQMISYFSNEIKARTAYLSITRGDGGQNLIGPELRAQLGLIRTQELLAARKTDGGEQFFTRANDFGYSKHPDETLALWNKEEVLKDVVEIIRQFKPDIIINRFDHRTPGSTHGHHTSSAMLSFMAFDKVADKNFIGHALNAPWQPMRLFFNTSPWFYGGQEKFEKVDKSNMLTFDTGSFFPSNGLSNPEIAALSRSKHQSQGFGSTGSRGSRLEYVEFLKGNFPKDKNNPFDGIDTSWNRVKGGKSIGLILKDVEADFDFKDPSKSVEKLVQAYALIQELENEHWKKIKSDEISHLIASCAGLYLEGVSNQSSTSVQNEINIKLEMVNRSSVPMKVVQISGGKNSRIDSTFVLSNNKRLVKRLKINIPLEAQLTSPYWLLSDGEIGMYHVPSKNLIGKPETPIANHINFHVEVGRTIINFERPIVYKYNDPVLGEVYQPFEIIPKFTSSVTGEVIIFGNNEPKDVEVTVRSSGKNLNGIVKLNLPSDWKVSPSEIAINDLSKGIDKKVIFKVIPPQDQSEAIAKPVVVSDGISYGKKKLTIDYGHIPYQTLIVPSTAKLVRLNIQKKGERIAYIHGAGDQVPTSLRQIGYTVIELNERDISLSNLQNFDAVILGIRAYNVNDAAQNYQQALHDYTENGGTLIVQYNTSRGLKVNTVSPLPLKLSRDRVVEENAPVQFLAANHEILNTPNKINNSDFDGWVQERGLYFPNSWSDEFTPILGMHDKGESEKKGSLLVAKFGKGHFIYTGLSFFRELPAGVPGAYKLFSNMLSIGKAGTERLKN